MIYHKHHILPRHAGGTDDPSNLVSLTIEEHAEEHRKLHEQYGRMQDFIAWKTLSGQITQQEAASLARKHRDTSYMQTDEYKKKISQANKGKAPWNKGLSGVQDLKHFKRGGSSWARKCYYDGVLYECVRDAMDASGLTKYFLYKHPTFSFHK